MRRTIYMAAAAILLIAGASSCKKSAFDINQNPNQATDSTISHDVILPAALHATGVSVSTPYGFLQNWMGFWARSGTYAPNVTEETYQITTGFANGVWNGLYDNSYDYQIMMIKAQQADADFYEGIARIMKSHNFQMLVDVYGNVPYTEALKGNANPTPKYDKGEDIYKDLFRQIDTGIALIRNADVAKNKDIAANDIMFAANKTSWIKFGNTLKLRMLVHLMNGGILSPQVTVPGFNIPNELYRIDTTTLTNGGGPVGYLGADQNAQINPGYKSDKPNPFYNSYKNNTAGTPTANSVYYKANEFAIDYYGWLADPRQTRFYAAGGLGLKGVAYGLPPINDNAATNLAGIGPALGPSATSAVPIMTAAESFLLQAEARQRGFITTGPTAGALLQSGILESFKFTGVASPSSALSSYLAFNASYPDVDINGVAQYPGGPVGGLFTIISQKYLALNGLNTLEVWNDYRRVNMSATVSTFVYGEGGGFDPGPPISVSPQKPAGAKIPVRLLYPQAEYNYNAGNVGAQGTITTQTRVFWDLQ
jgi:hypothetical protein